MYKENQIDCNDNYDFYDRIRQNLTNGFENYVVPSNSGLFSEKDFQNALNDATEAFKTKNYETLIEILRLLFNQFSIPEKEIQYQRCIIFQKYPLCSLLMNILDDPKYCMLSPYILQLFISILSSEDDQHNFSKYNHDNVGYEKVMHLKSQMDCEYYPLIFLYAYNIYPESSSYLVKETYELNYFTKISKDFYYSGNPNLDLAPLAIINLLRNNEIKKLPTNFFENMIPIANIEDGRISIFAMWCLYFYFKDSYKYAESSIKKDLLILLRDKINNSSDPAEVKISLFIFSICFMSSKVKIKMKCSNIAPIQKVAELIKSTDMETSQLSIIFCNNFIMLNPELHINDFVSNGTFDIVCEVAQIGPVKCKIEAGYLIVTVICNSSSEKQSILLNQQTLTILCDLLQINDEVLNFSILNLMLQYMSCYEWIVEKLLSDNFDECLVSLLSSSTNPVFISLSRKLLYTLNFKKKEIEES